MDQRDDTVRLTEAVIGLEQAVSGMAAVLERKRSGGATFPLLC